MMAVGLELLQLDYENAHFHKIGMKTGVRIPVRPSCYAYH